MRYVRVRKPIKGDILWFVLLVLVLVGYVTFFYQVGG
jgi:hypothetical protein